MIRLADRLRAGNELSSLGNERKKEKLRREKSRKEMQFEDINKYPRDDAGARYLGFKVGRP